MKHKYPDLDEDLADMLSAEEVAEYIQNIINNIHEMKTTEIEKLVNLYDSGG